MRTHLFVRAMLACVILLLTARIGFTQDAKLPDGIKHVPLDAMGFVHIRVGDFLKSDLGKTLLQEVRKDREASKGLKEVEKMLGLEVGDVESVTLLMLAPNPLQMNPWGGGPRKFYYGSVPGMPLLPVPKVEEKKVLDRKLDKEELEKKKAEELRRLEELRRAEQQRLEELKRLEQLKKQLDERKRRIDEELKAKPNKTALREAPILFQDEEQRRIVAELQRALVEREMLLQRQRLLEQGFQGGLADADFDEFGSSGRPLVILTTTKDLDRKKILRTQLFQMRPRDPSGPPMSDAPAVLFLSDRTVLLGQPWELARYSEAMARKPKTEALKSALALGAEPHLMVAGGQMPAELRQLVFSPFMPMARELAPAAPLFQTEIGIALNLGKSVDVKVQFKAATEAGAANALQAVKSVRVLGELAIEKGREAGESGGTKLELEKAFLKALADATIEQKDTTVHATVKLEVGPKVYAKFMKDIVAQLRSRGDRTRSVNNLKQIGLALHSYHDANNFLPPAGISDADGKPLLSWRVAILPYIEQQQLYRQFDLNQPWDHPTNKKLIAQMPAIYMVPGADTKQGETNYRGLVGPGTMFEPRKGPGGRAIGARLVQIPDGTSNTIMVVEAAESTIWTKPDDLPYNPNGPLPKFGTSPDGFHVLMGDGSVRFIRAGVREEVLRPYLTGNNGTVRQPLD